MKIVIASHNIGKIHEFRQLLSRFDMELLPQAELTVPAAKETGETFIENAILKARHAAAYTRMPAIADDSGLVVPALNGEPGIYSARYAGEEASDSKNIHKLLTAMRDIPEENRQAYFYCAIALMRHANDPTPMIAVGRWDGHILYEAVGENGFGYDPIFGVAKHRCAAAQLTTRIKNKISHRAKALKDLMRLLKKSADF